MKTVIACVDFSPVSDEVVKTAVELARALKGRLRLVHVTSIMPVAGGFESYQPVMDQLAGERLRLALKQLEELRKLHQSSGVEIITRLFEGMPVDHILTEAVNQKADLIVMGSHGMGMLRRLLVGSTAQGVLPRAPCPVVVVPSVKRASQETKDAAVSQTVI